MSAVPVHPEVSEAGADGPSAVAARGLTRDFAGLRAVDSVDLTVRSGAIFGLLGPDGAGKSTLIRMLVTVLRPTGGEASVFGASVTESAGQVTPRLGYMSQKFCMYPDLTVAENLQFFATIRGVSRQVRRERQHRLLTGMGLADFAGRQARHLSGGMKQKLMLAATLMHEPDLLLLDEPTTGVDPVSRREFWRILAGLHRSGKTVVVATPYMDEAERCTDIAFMQDGRISHRGTPQQVKDQVTGNLIEVDSPTPRQALAAVTGVSGVTTAHLYGDVVRLLWAGGQPIESLAQVLRAAGVQVRSISPAAVDMEAAFAVLAGTGPAGQPAEAGTAAVTGPQT